MTQFAYQVRDAAGRADSGTLTAGSVSEAARTLRGDGNTIVSLKETGARPAQPAADQPVRARVRRDDVVFFANQLAVMVDTGVPLSDALDSIAEQTVQPGFKSVVCDISERVKGGQELSAALAHYPKAFGHLFVAMVKASEASGTLGKMLQRVAAYLHQQRTVIKRVKGALAYPVGMLGFCVLIVVLMLAFVLPRFEAIYAGKKAALPLPTRMLLGLSNGIVSYWFIIVPVLAGLVTVALLLLRRPEGRKFLDGFRLNIPLMGSMFRKACLARSLRTLATMISTGVGVLDAIEIAAGVCGNYHFDRMWRDLADRLRQGSALADEMRKTRLIPPSVTQMVSAGERTGKLAMVLDRVAVFCEEDLDTAIRTSTSFIEPVMIVVMGLLVGGIALALLLPIFSLSKIVAN